MSRNCSYIHYSVIVNHTIGYRIQTVAGFLTFVFYKVVYIATLLRCPEIFNDDFIQNFLLNLSVREFGENGQHLAKLPARVYVDLVAPLGWV